MRNMKIAIPATSQDVTNYVNAIVGCTGEPVVISEGRSAEDVKPAEYVDFADFNVDDYDGLLMPGGADVNPARYGQENVACADVSDRLDEIQFAVLEQFVKARKPVFGICRGHQIINIYFGGTLHQDIPEAKRHAREKPLALNPDKVHMINANNGSWLAHLYDATFAVNSSHHQAVDQVGENLVVDARSSEDGVIEAMHHRTLPIYSVQFHPERMSFLNINDATVNGENIIWRLIRLCEKNA